MKNQVIELSEKDRNILEKLTKHARFFSIAYLVLWIILTFCLFTIMWILLR